jgi:archaellum component FlaC
MGRTNATYRNHLDSFIDNFRPFRKGAHSFAQAASYMNAVNPGLPAIISMLLGVQKETEENRDEIEKLKQRIQELEE